MGPPSKISKTEENAIIQWIPAMAKEGIPCPQVKKENEGYKVCTSFKKFLVFPTTPEKKTPKRKRVIFPAVVSSGKYWESETLNNDSSIYHDEDLDLNENEELDLEVGKYVIVRYQDNYFPGAEVRSMLNAGIGSWKWPAKEDLLYYLKDDIISVMKEPKTKDNSGTL
ncbi:hypothetical protein ILUMI_04394 [Ignelater luminosus]|uniref:Uncharacterized protein n=1 Tax=Ignelater luminosus TaxID=2038154 RepID=A0A8K0GL83_IGNLU|nr:hypothetical protein ILUMI_04394 [Ignelater luminosus]